jgi:hypothetical protein
MKSLEDREVIKEKLYKDIAYEYFNKILEVSENFNEYIKLIKNKSTEAIFDEKNGEKYKKLLEKLAISIDTSIETAEEVAEELDYLFSIEIKRDVIINNILKNKKS